MNELLTLLARQLVERNRLEDAIQLYKKLSNNHSSANWENQIQLLTKKLQYQSLKNGKKLRIVPSNSFRPGMGVLTQDAAPLPAGPEAIRTLHSPTWAEDCANASLRAYKGDKDLGTLPPHVEIPLVTVVMTTYNAQDTVALAVESLLFQTYPKIELVICDDCSSDNTWQLLQQLAKRSPNHLKVCRLGTNSGTYLAKNRAISISKGEIILFQDSDDYSHPDRVLIQALPLIKEPKLMATRTKYLRFNPDNSRVMPVENISSRYGMITLATRKKAFDEIGYFAPARRAADYEWSHRLTHIYGADNVRSLDFAGYLAEFKTGSLTDDLLNAQSDGSIKQTLSEDRKNYVVQFRAHYSDKSKDAAWYKATFPANPLHPAEDYPPSIAALAHMTQPVFGAVVSRSPERRHFLETVLECVLPQLDHLYVYLENYESVPSFLEDPRITALHLQDQDSASNNDAVFLGFDILKKQAGPFYYFIFDDELVYPPEYTRALIDRIQKYGNAVIVGVHGVLYTESPTDHLQHHEVFHYASDPLFAPRLVNHLGTGTFAFHSEVFHQRVSEGWGANGMGDISFATAAKRQQIPMICMDRIAGWLTANDEIQDKRKHLMPLNDSDSASVISQLCQSRPWGYKPIVEAIDAQSPALREKLYRLLPRFAYYISMKNSRSRFIRER